MRKVIPLTSALMFAVASCSSPESFKNPVPSVDAFPSTTYSLPVVISSLPPVTANICIDIGTITDWPISKAAEAWNKNGINNLIISDTPEGCTGKVVMNQVLTHDYCGETQFYLNGEVRVTFSTSSVCRQQALSVVCHELGHVLGRPHIEDKASCMDPKGKSPVPTPQDLDIAGSELWNQQKIARRIAER